MPRRSGHDTFERYDERIALGARGRDVLRAVVGTGALLTVSGILEAE